MSNKELVGRMTNDAFGEWAENALRGVLEGAGWAITKKKGSLGASDLIAEKGPTQWYIQVKATRETSRPVVSAEDIRRVVNSASANGAVPVMGLLWFQQPNGTYDFQRADNGTILTSQV